MSDKKLNELIDEYAFQIVDKGGLCTNDCDVDILKARQGIIDYMEKGVKQLEYALECEIGRTKWVKNICGKVITFEQARREVLKPIREVIEKYKDQKMYDFQDHVDRNDDYEKAMKEALSEK